MKKKLLIIGIIFVLLIIIIATITYYNSEYIIIEEYGPVGGPTVMGWEPTKKGYIIANSRQVIRYENDNKTFIGKIEKEDLEKLVTIIQDEVKNKDISEFIVGSRYINSIEIKGEFHYIYDSFRVKLEEFINQRIVK